MGSKTKRLFEHMRSMFEKPSSSTRVSNLLPLGVMEESDTLGSSLHKEAIVGNRRALKKVLQTSICVDYPNDKGQTPLFCACACDSESTALLLLQHGANPNEKSQDGLTPAHAACHMGNVRLLGKLIEAGGDLRLHDNDGRGMRDWAMLNPDAKSRLRMLQFLDKTHVYAMTFSGDAVSIDRFTSYARRPQNKTSLMEIMRVRTGSDTSFENLRRVHSTGFGKVYLGNDNNGGLISVIPLVSEALLFVLDDTQFDTGQGSFMESMEWIKMPVTVRQMKPDVKPEDVIDLFITDAEYLGKLRHPNVLLLMGICQSMNFDAILLIFENIEMANLHNYLHQLGNHPQFSLQMTIANHVCHAMDFIHNQNLIHCGLSSMAVYLVSSSCVKVGNFEFMVESGKADLGKTSRVSHISSGRAVYNWMSPELLMGHTPRFCSDIYSYCCILWETFTGEMPWEGQDPDYIKYKVVEENQPLNLAFVRLPSKLRAIIGYGLELKPDERLQKFSLICDWLKSDNARPRWPPHDRKNKSGNFTEQNSSSSSTQSSVREEAGGEGRWTQDNLCFSSSDSFQEVCPTPPTIETVSHDSPSSLSPINACLNSPLMAQKNSAKFSLPVKPASHFQFKNGACSTLPSAGNKRKSNCLEMSGGGSLNQLYQANNNGRLSSQAASAMARDFLSQPHLLTDKPGEKFESPQTNCVRMLTESFQMRLNQHSLRQAILQGSMAPKGSCMEMDISTDSVRQDNSNRPGIDKPTQNNGYGSDPIQEITSSDMANLSCLPMITGSSTPKMGSVKASKEKLTISRKIINPKLLDLYSSKLLRDVGTLSGQDFDNGDYEMKTSRGAPRDITGGTDGDTKEGRNAHVDSLPSTGDYKCLSSTKDHQAFLDEIKLVHRLILRRSHQIKDRESSPGVPYHSPVIETRRNRQRFDKIPYSNDCCTAGDSRESGLRISNEVNAQDLPVRSQPDFVLDDSFWNISPHEGIWDKDGDGTVKKDDVKMTEHQMLLRNSGNRHCESKVVVSPKYIIANGELCLNASLTPGSEGKGGSQCLNASLTPGSEGKGGSQCLNASLTPGSEGKGGSQCLNASLTPGSEGKGGSQDRSSKVKCMQSEENPDKALTVMDSTFVIQREHSVAEKNFSMTQDSNADSDKVDGWVEHKLETILDKMSIRPSNQGQETDSSGSFHGLKDISSSSTLGEGLLRPEKPCANVLPDLQTGKKPAENPGNEVEDKLMKIETVKSAPEIDGCDFEFREFYIDDDFEDGERVSSRPMEDLDCNVSTRHNSTDCLPDKSRHVTKHIRAKSPFSLARLIMKPPVAPSKWPIVHHTNSRGNMSQSALGQNEEDINKMQLRKSQSEKDTKTKDDLSFSFKIPGVLKGNPGLKGRGVPAEPKFLTSNSSLRHGMSGQSISLSCNEVGSKVNDDETLVEVDGDLNTVTDEDVPDTVWDKEINRKVSALQHVTAPSQLTQVNESCQVSLPGDRPKAHYDSDSAESDPWVQRKLKIIQEKIRRRKARESYTVSSDDDVDPGYVGTDDQLLPLASPGSNYMLPWEQSDPCPDRHPDLVLSSTEYKITKNDGLVDKRDYKSHENGSNNLSPATNRRSQENKKNKYNPKLSDIASNNSRAMGIDTSQKLRQAECQTENSSDKHESTTTSRENKSHHGSTEIKHPSILRRTSKISSSYKQKEGKGCLNQVPTRVPHTKSKVSASHGSKSTERVISFKDLTDTDHDKPSTSKFKTQTHLTRPESEVTEQSPQLERSFVSISEDFETKTVKTWLEKHNFAESSCTSSPQPTDHHTLTSRVLEHQDSQSGIQNTPSKHSVFSKHSLEKVSFIYKEDAIHKNPTALTPQRQEALSWINSDVSLKEKSSDHKLHRGKPSCSMRGEPEGDVSRCGDDDDLTEAKVPENLSTAVGDVRHKSYNPITINDHFVTLALQTPATDKLESQTGKQRKQKCKLGLHRFYIPRDMWPEGCKARLDVSVSPTHPDCHRVVTTATDPVSGREETLMDQTICTEKLRSTLQLD